VRVEPGATVRILLWTFVAPSREQALDIADKCRDPQSFDRINTMAWTRAQVQLHHLGIDMERAHLYQRIANAIIYADPAWRAAADPLYGGKGPEALWPHGISGDLPIVLVRVDEVSDREIARQMICAHEYWRLKRLEADLVILNERPVSYMDELQTALDAALQRTRRSGEDAPSPRGRVFVLSADRISAADKNLLRSVARVELVGRRGGLAEQVERLARSGGPAAPPPRRPALRKRAADAAAPQLELELFNGLGGFAADGREYVIVLGEGQWTPAPWINVISNENFGFQVSELGSGYTWSLNSRENQITPWSNDPVADPPGETILLRDEETGEIWGPTPLPSRRPVSPYVVRHGQGYSRFEHRSAGISLDLLQFVPPEDTIRISRLIIENRSSRTRRLTVTSYVEWVLGSSRSISAPHIATEMDSETGAMFATNFWNREFAGRVAFLDLGGRQVSWTGDRVEFLGRNGSLDYPSALARGGSLSGSTGAGLDPCGALQTRIEIRPGARTALLFLLGDAQSKDAARRLIRRYRAADPERTLQGVKSRWDEILGCLEVRTPDRSMDILLNRWLLYQTLSCRVWGRAGFYQAGGAYGFRDQLQDVLALIPARRDIARSHILRAAARQFVEGDVLHWWHPPSGRGVRTRISDDLLWLPYAVLHWVKVTGDYTILDEQVGFLEGPVLKPEQEDLYFEPSESDETGTLFEHCARAADRSLRVGAHRLPLMGTGDWNDGMNRVGHEGKGESVWLGWFLESILPDLSKLAEERGETERAERWRHHAQALKEALEDQGWDGDWYRRAYFDDGTPLGTASASECRIDAIAQSWSLISGAGDRARAARAMAAVEEYLVRRGEGLVLLFTPPFNRTAPDPGYIRGYVPGVRENGGQYTHGALWSLIAFAELGEGDKAGELFSLLNPINHSATRVGAHRYKVEPYVIAGDVYAEHPHTGRGGWTWYTGSAGWMYRAGIEWILGFRLRGENLELDPCIPRAWHGYEISFRYHSAVYRVAVQNPRGATRGIGALELDGVALPPGTRAVRLSSDGATHVIRVTLGSGV
jgi:cyclic beta-1,2-glucan synthetase